MNGFARRGCADACRVNTLTARTLTSGIMAAIAMAQSVAPGVP